MNILFINPNPYKLGNRNVKLSVLDKLLNQFHFYPALTFPMLAAVTPLTHSINFIDELNYKNKMDRYNHWALYHQRECNRCSLQHYPPDHSYKL